MASYVFVNSFVNLAEARGPRRAFVVHMAEGGGTVGYLSRENPNGVSVHFVIERTGRIVQMLGLSRMHTSIRVSSLRVSDDPPYDWLGTPIKHGVTAARAVMGDWATTQKTLGPNHASIAVEIEGYAKDGPNDKQKDSLAALYFDMQQRFPGIKALGHRDFASYKACPGKKIPWQEIGGHAGRGPVVEEDVDVEFDIVTDQEVGRLYVAEEGAWYYDLVTRKMVGPLKLTSWPGGKYPILPVRLRKPVPVAAAQNTDDWKLGYIVGTSPAFILKRNVRVVPVVTTDLTPYSQVDIDKALERGRQQIKEAVAAL